MVDKSLLLRIDWNLIPTLTVQIFHGNNKVLVLIHFCCKVGNNSVVVLILLLFFSDLLLYS